MKWQGETELQWRKRVAKWHKRFAYIPVQMDDGVWVFWDYYYVRVHFGFRISSERMDIEKFKANHMEVNGEWQSLVSPPASQILSRPPPPRQC